MAPQKTPQIVLLAVRDAYLNIDQEDYCHKGVDRCGECFGCADYKTLRRAWQWIKKNHPELTK